MAEKNVQIVDKKTKNNLYPKTKGSIVINNAGANLGDVEAGAQVNKIEKIKVNGVELSIITKEVDITLPDSYTKIEADDLFATKSEVSAIPKFAVKVVDELPLTGEAATVYLVKTGSENDNLYTEYIYVDGSFEELGTQKIDISGKQDQLTTAQLEAVNSGITEALVTKFNGYEAAINGKQDELTSAQLANIAAVQNKADKATTLAGYGIENAYTKTEADSMVDSKLEELDYITYVEIVD